MKLLVLATAYPDQHGSVASMFIHTRNQYYVQHGWDVTTLNFATEESYTLDGISVISPAEYERSRETYDIVLAHAPNLRNHYRFLKKYGQRFSHIVFFFHGHEVLKLSEIYPEPFPYVHRRNRIVQDAYDALKVCLWKHYFEKNASKIHLVFVSQWLYAQFQKYVRLDPALSDRISSVIHNAVAAVFETQSHPATGEEIYDFITIRGNLDDAKYGVDIVNDLAHRYPQYQFCLIGKGEFFSHNPRPDNLFYVDHALPHREMLQFLDRARYALMPTREDTQGVMSCEMLTYGMPLITSNIDVCKEIFGSFQRVELVENDAARIDLPSILIRFEQLPEEEKTERYFAENTMAKELDLFLSLLADKI